MNSIINLCPILVLALSACSSNGKDGETNPVSPVSMTATSDEPSPEPSKGCNIRYDNVCYATSEEACAVARCPTDHCTILESYPGQLVCDSRPHSIAVATGMPLMVVAESIGGDDGAAFDILVGVSGYKDAGVKVKVGGLVGYSNDLCQFKVTSHVSMNVAYYAEMDKSKTIALDKSSLLSVFRGCEEGQKCGAITSGSLVIDSFTPGVGAKGHYSFQTDSGAIESPFEAQWCGPKRGERG